MGFRAVADMRPIVPFTLRSMPARLVARIGAEIVLPRSTRHLHDELVQRGLKQFYVMRVCAAATIDNGTPIRRTSRLRLRPFFSPIRGVGATHSVASGLCASRRRYSANSMQWLPSRRTQPVGLPQTKKKPACCHF